MTSAPEQAATARADLVTKLVERGAITTPQWREAFAVVPREIFVPEFERRENGGKLVRYNAETDGFLSAVYSDASLLTQRNAAGVATSSSTQPSLMAIMLERLDVHDGHTVMEIGAGTGYNAALLSCRLGDDAVTTIDIDPAVTAAAQEHLNQAGYHPRVATGDGSEGVADRGPFDRVIATCGVSRIPADWIKQTKPGGKILANASFGLVLLAVDDNGGASGSFDAEPAAFMQLRHNADGNSISSETAILDGIKNQEGRERETVLPQEFENSTVEFLSALIMPSVHRTTFFTNPPSVALVDDATGAWVKVQGETGAPATLTEHGDRSLWEEQQTIIREWEQLGKPSVSAYALTITSDGTHHLTHPETGWSRTLDGK